ncbi:MAG: hypothetical protein RR086_03610 [Clostridia bacterium]
MSEVSEITLSQAQMFLTNMREDLLTATVRPHFVIAFRLAEASRLNFAEALGYDDIYALADAEFGFKSTSTKNYISVYNQYHGLGMEIDKQYDKFSFTQLVEMLSISSFERRHITPDMSIARIRAWKQFHKFVTVDGITYMYGDLSDKQKATYEKSLSDKKNKVSSTDSTKCATSEPLLSIPLTVSSTSCGKDFPLMGFKNKEARKSFLEDYVFWGVWLKVPQLHLTCYRANFVNGSSVVVSTYLSVLACYSANSSDFDLSNTELSTRYHLLRSPQDEFILGGLALTSVIDYFTNNAKVL